MINKKYFIYNLGIIFIPFFVFFALILYYIYDTEVTAGKQILRSQEMSNIRLQEQIISRDYREIISELRFIGSLQEIKKAVNRTGHDKNEILNDFYHLSLYKGLYDQIRYLDQTGKEVFRVNYNDGHPSAVPDTALQNKGNRYYFKETINQDVNEVFMSPLDLNIELGKIEQPLKPMIRFGMPLKDSNGNKSGIVLLNYRAGILIKDLERVVASGSPGRFSLLNDKGYWLTGPDKSKCWGFMYPDKKQITFAKAFPDEWKKISASESGQFLSSKGLFTFGSFFPLKNIQKPKGSHGTLLPCKSTENKTCFFKLVSHVPGEVISENAARVFKKLLMLYILLIFILIAGAVYFATVREQKRQTAEERQKLIKELQTALDEVKSLQGVIPICSYCKEIRDEEGVWNKLEAYIHSHSDAEFTHGVCPKCLKEQLEKLESEK